MAIKSSVVTVTATAVVLVPNTLGRSIGDPIPVLVKNTGANNVYLGGPDVVAGVYPLAPTEAAGLNVVFTDTLWAVCDSAKTTTVALMIGRQ